MARPKKVSPSPAVKTTTVLDRIRAAEKSLLTGATERVLVSDSDLETIAGLILDSGSTKAQLLKKAVHLGLAVLTTTLPAPSKEDPQGGCMTDFSPEDLEVESDWKRPEPIPYGGFELRRPAGRHEPVASDPNPIPDTQFVSPEEGVV